MKIYLVDAFTSCKYEGNRAGIIVDADKLSPMEKQQIAAEINASESAFITRSEVADFKIEFFTPTQEIDFCGHNTVAAFYLLAALGKIRATENGCKFSEETKAGIIPVEVSKRGGDFLITMTQNQPRFKDFSIKTEAIARALKIAPSDLDDRFTIKLVNTGNWFLMVGLRSEQTLHELTYDSQELSKILKQVEAIGAYIFYMTDVDKYHARSFCPTIGIPEDPATGAAAGAFGAYLINQGIVKQEVNQLNIRQGEAIGRPGNILVDITQRNGRVDSVKVSGTAVVSFELLTELNLVSAATQ